MKLISILFASLTLSYSAWSQDELPRNTIMVESNFILMGVISYDRITPVSNKASIMFGGDYIMGLGFGYGSHWIAPEFGGMFFGPKHFMESGIQLVINVDKQELDQPDEMEARISPGIRLAYRYQAFNGLTLRATANAVFLIDPIFIPTIGIGYSF